MSNILEVEIEARVPWDWAQELPESEAAAFASVFFNSVIGLSLEQESDGYDRNEHGGDTSMVILRIGGAEALSWKFLARMVWALEQLGEVSHAEAMDVQWPDEQHRWEPISRDYEPAPNLNVTPSGQYMNGRWAYEVEVGFKKRRATSITGAIKLGRALLRGES